MESVMKRVKGFIESNSPNVTLAEIRKQFPEIPVNSISTTLCYLLKRKRVTREIMPNPNPVGRKNIYVYSMSIQPPPETTNG